ncbi:ABATE domain-containing protein [Neorhizobium sp. Rsf11]|uniref:ABATE domain-containing protein n=2 Tax=Neorhizobium TaxID=1525371 RepID=A0ABV0MD61_9HYPH|nr:ABATE domain-containing protein [Neorhizobium petrolearium]MCC2613730.1 CGNR zinc finger domain-containing protein [Neorhizobium petrolearium]WGI72042.1 CGNR zinc finger domain-containing protein [Neorhizobium petrolearium]
MVLPNPPAIFVADAVGLDFLNSVATPVDRPVEWLGDGAGLIQWLREADLVPERTLEAIANNAMPGELDSVASHARSLREWFRSFVLEHKGKPLSAKAITELEPLNRLLARDEQFIQITIAEDERSKPRLQWDRQRRWKSPETLLAPIAEAMGQLVCTEEFTDIKACEGHDCTLLFIDRTRGRRRRWCSMAVCGNRAKQAAHRARAN